ncbi:uracil-DNA glycosylase [Maribacter arcticus]|uniref:Uracil-DNA glycosylase n=1 Tax=Maribacter arcticus TaxID=561365 RepID=A0A1T5DTL1_9FLAO|nr:uracil-DNA glycosylase [Maribacter arcticus]SKB75064.1 Uracil-DNA glycosylase [Maribacter arcticus]|tara:strand:+ start:2865 stop:3530 length:666 start_codon:yes stop_codon:yes gene_type:complete
MTTYIHPSWKQHLQEEFDKPYFKKLTEFVNQEYAQHTCYPKYSNIFSAFNHSPFDKTKVVIIGQDPYHGPNQANGLCFSVKDGIKHPPSLVNIFKEIEIDLGAIYPESGNLQRWADQGVLLLNATLTVREHEPGSHQKKGWEKFTDVVISKLSDERSDIVFMLWGGFAKKKTKLIDSNKHHILTSGHPSPLSANRGYWFGNKHFSICNNILNDLGNKSLIW